MSIKLPLNYSVEDRNIVRRWSDKKGDHTEVVAYGTIRAISVRQYSDNPNEMSLIVRFSNNDGTRCENVPIPIKQLTGNGKKLLALVPDWFVLLGASPTKRLSFLQQTLNLQRAEITEIVTVQRVGMGYHVSADGSLFYVLGHLVINLPPDVNIETISPFHLRTVQSSADEPPGQCIAWVRKFCGQGPPQAALFVAALTSYIRPILEAVGNFNHFAVYVWGESGTGKTESAKLLCSLFTEQSGATLSSDRRDIFRLMSTFRDLPFLVDDLNDSRIASAAAKKRERLSEIVQQVSGSGILSIRSETFDVGHTTPVVTAESLLKSYSTINRTLIVAFEQPFDPETLTWLQEHRSLYVSFLTGFIRWLCQHHTRLETCVRSWDFSNLSGGIKKPDEFVGLPRLMRTFTILKTALELFLLHLSEVYACPQEDKRFWQQLLDEGINQAVFSDTLEQLRREDAEQERFLVDAVLDIFDEDEQQYKAKYKRVAASYDKYMELNKQASIDGRIPKKLFFLSSDKEYYRFRGNDLVEYLTDQYGSQYKASKKVVSGQLDYYGLLQRYGGELSYPVTEDSEHHYYSLRRDIVEDMRKKRRDEFLAKVDNLAFGNGDNNDDKKWTIARR